MIKLAIVTTHPIQYNAPWFRMLSEKEGVDVKVFYTWEQSESGAKYDPDFKTVIEWDIPLLNGYEYTFVKNISEDPGSHHFKGIITPTLNNDIEEWGADAVLVFGWAFKGHLACLKYFKGKIPVLFRGDSTLLDEKRGLKQMVRRLFLTYIYRNIDYAFYVGTNNKDYFLAHGLKESQLIFVPHAIDNERFKKESVEKDSIRFWQKKLNIHENDLVVLFAGKLEEKKNPKLVIDLAKELPDSRLKFIIVGNGPLLGELEKYSNDSRIQFVGFQNQSVMPIMYQLSDIYILPSNGPGETWGLAINEAIAANKYVITTNKVGCAIDLIEEGQNGAVIKPNDLSYTKEYVQTLLNDRNATSNRRDDINQKILSTYSFSNIVSNITDFLNKTLTKKR